MRGALKGVFTCAAMAVAIGGCAGGAMPNASGGAAAASGPSYAVYGAERYFTLEWQPDERKGRPVVRGYVTNQWGWTMRHVRLRVEALDTAGAVTASDIAYVSGDVTPGSRVYFEVPVHDRAPSYRVSVLSFDPVQGRTG
jgi:hypothetical protein